MRFTAPIFRAVRATPAGEDDRATYTLLSIPALPGVDVIGTLIEPKKHAPRMPVIIANHGRGGMPAMPPAGKISVMTDSNRDLARGAVERGWAVFEPIFLFYGTNYPEGIRDILTSRAQEAGTTLEAIEITKLVRAVDYLSSRPELDPDRVGMVGISYGGFYTLYPTALEPRIPCRGRRGLLQRPRPSSGLQRTFRLLRLALSAQPQPFYRSANRCLSFVRDRWRLNRATRINSFRSKGPGEPSREAAGYYAKLHLGSNFEFHEFVGRHDFDGEAAWAFIDRQMSGH